MPDWCDVIGVHLEIPCAVFGTRRLGESPEKLRGMFHIWKNCCRHHKPGVNMAARKRELVLRIVTIVALFFTVTESKALSKKRGLLGGYRNVDLSDPSKARLVQGLAQASLVKYNAESNDLVNYKISAPKQGSQNDVLKVSPSSGIVSAQYKIVTGIVYKIKFRITSDGCKNGSDEKFCHGKTKTCSSEVWMKPYMVQGQPSTETTVKCI